MFILIRQRKSGRSVRIRNYDELNASFQNVFAVKLWRMLPFEGTITDQPYMTMQIIRLVQANYRKHLNDKMKQIKSKR